MKQVKINQDQAEEFLRIKQLIYDMMTLNELDVALSMAAMQSICCSIVKENFGMEYYFQYLKDLAKGARHVMKEEQQDEAH